MSNPVFRYSARQLVTRVLIFGALVGAVVAGVIIYLRG